MRLSKALLNLCLCVIGILVPTAGVWAQEVPEPVGPPTLESELTVSAEATVLTDIDGDDQLDVAMGEDSATGDYAVEIQLSSRPEPIRLTSGRHRGLGFIVGDVDADDCADIVIAEVSEPDSWNWWEFDDADGFSDPLPFTRFLSAQSDPLPLTGPTVGTEFISDCAGFNRDFQCRDISTACGAVVEWSPHPIGPSLSPASRLVSGPDRPRGPPRSPHRFLSR